MGVVRVLGVLLVAACGAKAPAVVENVEQTPAPQPRAKLSRTVRMARPAIDVTWALPDFHDDLR